MGDSKIGLQQWKKITSKDFISPFSVDATFQDGLCRYVNDSPYPNCKMVVLKDHEKPFLCLFAKKEIQCGMELR